MFNCSYQIYINLNFHFHDELMLIIYQNSFTFIIIKYQKNYHMNINFNQLEQQDVVMSLNILFQLVLHFIYILFQKKG